MTSQMLLLIDIVARKLGYDYVLLDGLEDDVKHCVFGTWDKFDRIAAKTDSGQLIDVNVADMHYDVGYDVYREQMYRRLARKLYVLLDNGDAVHAAGKEVSADDVPEFMMECVLNGLAER